MLLARQSLLPNQPGGGHKDVCASPTPGSLPLLDVSSPSTEIFLLSPTEAPIPPSHQSPLLQWVLLETGAGELSELQAGAAGSAKGTEQCHRTPEGSQTPANNKLLFIVYLQDRDGTLVPELQNQLTCPRPWDNSTGQGKTVNHPKMGSCVCSGFLTQALSSSVSVPVPALPAGMGDTSTMTTETFLQGEQGISHGDIPAMLWLVALQGISCGDMLGILWLLPFQPLQTSSHLTPQSDAPSLCLLSGGPAPKSSD